VDVVGIEIGIAFLLVIAVACVGYLAQVWFLQREVRRAMEARRVPPAGDGPVAVAQRSLTIAGSRLPMMQARGRQRMADPVEDDEIRDIIAEAEAIVRRRELSGSRPS
jgi:hypothetical protein